MIHSLPLQRLIERSSLFHPWYSSLLKSLGINPALTHLSELPLITADKLEQHYFVAEPRTEAGLSVYRTSGTSSGIRKAIYYSEEDDEHYIASKTASFRDWLAHSLPSGHRSNVDHSPVIHKALADMGTGHAASTALTIFKRLGLQADSLSFALPIEEHIERLRTYKPGLLYTMPSILDAIVAAAPEPEHFGIRKIIVVGEAAPLEWQANIAARFGIAEDDILDTYGSIEIGAIASYSHALKRYIITDGIYAEGLPAEQIDPELDPLQANESVLVLTSSVRTLFPAIRYVTYDVVRDFETIELDGRPRQCFSCLSKRIGTDFKHGEKISIYDIEAVVHRYVKDAELRVRLRDNKLLVHIKSKSLEEPMLAPIQFAIEHTIAEIGQMIQNRMLSGIEVTRAADDELLERGTVKSKKLYL